jgi:hypothetical protein
MVVGPQGFIAHEDADDEKYPGFSLSFRAPLPMPMPMHLLVAVLVRSVPEGLPGTGHR